MKKLITLLLSLLISSACSQPKEPIDMKMLKEKEMEYPIFVKYFTKDTNEPYSGEVFSLNEFGKKEWEGKLVDGLRHGIWKENEYRYTDGKLAGSKEIPFKNGKIEGIVRRWYEPPIYPKRQIFTERNFKNGEESGLQIEYYDPELGGGLMQVKFRGGEKGQKTIWEKVYNTDGSINYIKGDTTLKQ